MTHHNEIQYIHAIYSAAATYKETEVAKAVLIRDGLISLAVGLVVSSAFVALTLFILKGGL